MKDPLELRDALETERHRAPQGAPNSDALDETFIEATPRSCGLQRRCGHFRRLEDAR
jgi:hypothetical protein